MNKERRKNYRSDASANKYKLAPNLCYRKRSKAVAQLNLLFGNDP